MAAAMELRKGETNENAERKHSYKLDRPFRFETLLDGRLLTAGITEIDPPTPASNSSQSLRGITDGEGGVLWFLVDADGICQSAYQDRDHCCCEILYWLDVFYDIKLEIVDDKDIEPDTEARITTKNKQLN
jgi:hypothetical protein